MKKFSFLALAAVALLITACSTNDAVSDVQNPTTLEGKGKGFLNVSVNLPTRPNVNSTTRAWAESAQLDDGTANEYAVQSVLIVIFGGASEAEATVQQIESPAAGDADSWNKIGTTTDQVTTRKNYVFQLNDGVTGPFYALAIINGNGIIDKDGDKLKVNGTTTISDCKIGDLVAAVSQAGTDGKHKFINSDGYFFMTNAVLSEAKGGSAAVNTAKGYILAPVTNIYESQSEAEAANAAPSADIYVERGVAKVTMTASLSFDANITGKGITLATPALSGWVLDNTNMKSYIVRNTPKSGESWNWGWKSNGIASTDVYRFVGYNGVDQTSPTVTEAYRTYWCVDPNYNSDYNKANFYEPATKSFPTDPSLPQYCYENTFDVAHQSYQNTTRAIVKLDLNGGNDFYTMGTDRKTLYAEASVKNAVIARLIMDANFQKWFQSKSTATLDASCIGSVTWNSNTKAGVIKVSEITIKKDKLTTPPTDDVALTTINETIGGITIKGTDILTAIAGLYGTIKRYVGGATYYSIRIKHFGDDLTPWGWNSEEESTIDKIYPVGTGDARNENYLGRYGMVRNNWYELELGTILKIGSAVVPRINPDNPNPDPDDPDPEDPEHPDDSLDDSFINARINILSWAKRTQSWNLK
jgi:hypothetical protein